MKNRTHSIDHATPIDDISGLKLSSSKLYTMRDIYEEEANNILEATVKYLSAVPSKKEASFSYSWLLTLHEEMFSHVWEWAGKLRHTELSIGVKAYLVPTELKKLTDDIAYWKTHKTFSTIETATRIHHRAVQIHPFQNGNGRWSRMLANIYMRQNGLMPVKWQEDLLSKENVKRDAYIEALKRADGGEYDDLIAMHEVMY